MFLDLKHLFRKSITLSYQSYLENILDVVLHPNHIKKSSLHFQHSKQDSASVAPLRKHNSVHQDDPTESTILNEQFQSVSVGSLLTASAPFVTRQESTDADRSMLDNAITSKGIDNNLNPHKAAGPDQIKPSTLHNLSTPLSPILKHLF